MIQTSSRLPWHYVGYSNLPSLFIIKSIMSYMRTSTIHSNPWHNGVHRVNKPVGLLIYPAPADHLDLAWRQDSPQCPHCQSPGRRGQDSQCVPSSQLPHSSSAERPWSSDARRRRDAGLTPNFLPCPAWPAGFQTLLKRHQPNSNDQARIIIMIRPAALSHSSQIIFFDQLANTRFVLVDWITTADETHLKLVREHSEFDMGVITLLADQMKFIKVSWTSWIICLPFSDLKAALATVSADFWRAEFVFDIPAVAGRDWAASWYRSQSDSSDSSTL